MIRIYKVTNSSAIDFAAEELKKYFRMMMPEENEIDIEFNASAKDGFRLGLFSDLGIDGEVEDPRYDDMLFADCDGTGGIIAGINPRSVLLSVYEYLRQNGIRWLYPGTDGEYIPIKEITPIKFSIKPSCRYRGYANTSAASAQTTLEIIDFLPKIGMNTFMFEFRIPTFYTNNYYEHKRNGVNRPSEKVTPETILQWKRGAECEVAKRGLVFHDVGHGFCIDAFGIDSCHSWYETDEKVIPEGARKYLAKIGGKRGFFGGVPINTNFCMSDKSARRAVADYVANYAAGHKNVDLLHVWLADGCDNHCECEECVKKTASDWYVDLLNDIDEVMTERNIATKIVFLSYVDTSWAPTESRIKNQDRFVFMLAPFTRTYYDSIPKGEIAKTSTAYKRNQIYRGKTLEDFLGFYNDWREGFGGPAFAFEYHFCWTEYYDFSRFEHAKTIHDEIVLYKKMGIDGVVEDGDMRPFLPNGLLFYTLGRTLFDTSLTVEEIIEDYFSHAYGKDWRSFYDYFKKLGQTMDYKYYFRKNSKNEKVSLFYNPDISERYEKELPALLAEGRELVKQHYLSDIRVETVTVRLLEDYLDLCEQTAKIIVEKARGNDDGAIELYNEFEAEYGKRECKIERYFNHTFYFNWLHYLVFDNQSRQEFVL